MVKKKYYAVRKGFKTGIFGTWDECKRQTSGYSGAEFKGFTTLKEAEDFLGINSSNESCKNEVDITSDSKAVAYVDGSYNIKTKEFSYGMVMFHNDKEEHFCEKYNTANLREMRNVAGEIMGSRKAMSFCIEKNIEVLDIYYDYEGIEKWCTGVWKANKLGTIDYKKYYDSIKNKLKVNFFKVTGHSGDKYNDLADSLAKQAFNEDSKNISLDDNYVVNNVNLDDMLNIIEELSEDIDGLCIRECEEPNGKGYILSIKKPNDQKLKVIYYEDKRKLHIQGKKKELFNAFSNKVN